MDHDEAMQSRIAHIALLLAEAQRELQAVQRLFTHGGLPNDDLRQQFASNAVRQARYATQSTNMLTAHYELDHLPVNSYQPPRW